MIHHEYLLQKEVCKFLDINYPDVMYMSDTIANVKLTLPQQARNKAIQKEGFKCPDLIIFEPKGMYKGFFIELKIKSPFKKDGGLYKNDHLKAQERTMLDLNKKGYLCFFAWNIKQVQDLINYYMHLK